MKKIVYLLIFVSFLFTLRAQDTIYPFDPDYPFFNDSAYSVQDSSPWSVVWLLFQPCVIRTIEHTHNTQSVVTGLAIPYRFGTMPLDRDGLPWPNNPDTISIQGVLLQIDSNDYEHPTIYYTNPVVWNYNETPHVRPYDCHLAFRSSSMCDTMDTVVEAYSLYFDSPIAISGNVYLGILRTMDKDTRLIHRYENDGEGLLIPGWNSKCDSSYPVPEFVWYWFGCFDTTIVDGGWNIDRVHFSMNYPSHLIGEPQRHPSNFRGSPRTICPIVTIPDTDTFGCPEVEGFAFAGMNAGSPTFVWDTAAEHDYYQIAYGAYNLSVRQLQKDTTSRNFIELFGLSPDIYYQVRVRARCHHRCPIHDTVMWTAWSAPVYFYTGDHMPDTTHQPEGIDAPGEVLPFAIVPNPSRSGARQVVEIGRQVPLQGLTLTLHDAAGHEVLRMEVKEHRFALPASLPAGVYVATLASPQGTAVRRVVVES